MPEHLRLTARRFVIFIALLLAWLCSGCLATTPAPTPLDSGQISTQAAETVIARFTQVAGSQTPTYTASFTARFTAVPSLPPSSTPTSLPTETPIPTLASTDTLVPTPTPSETPLPCNLAQFLRDVTIPENTQINPGAGFFKTWQLRNIGNCIWDTNYELRFVSGESFGFQEPVRLMQPVFPGDVVNISTYLSAPASPGVHRGGFMLQADDGSLFGVSTEGFGLFWVQVMVVESNLDFSYDFATNFCLARWENQYGELACPGNTNDPNGFVALIQAPTLESRQEDEPGIWIQPMQTPFGWVQGSFPPIRLGENQRFLADIGCLEGYPDCDVIFQLNYRYPGGVMNNLGEWREVYDGETTRINLLLTGLSGRTVEFIFTVLANGSPVDDAAIWLAPHLQP